MSQRSANIPKGLPWEDYAAQIQVDGPLAIFVEQGLINVIMPNKDKRWQLWPAETATHITAEEGDTIEAFKFKMTVTDRV